MKVWRLLSEFLSQGITIFMATPYLDEAERCSRVALMSQGRILALAQNLVPDDPLALDAASANTAYVTLLLSPSQVQQRP